MSRNPPRSPPPILLNNNHQPPPGAMDWLRHHFTQLGTLAAHPTAFSIVCAYGVLWFDVQLACHRYPGDVDDDLVHSAV
jgi:hypothetical protein